MVDHDIPSDGAVYRHTETADRVEYIGRQGGEYLFRINQERTMSLDTKEWPGYREYLDTDK